MTPSYTKQQIQERLLHERWRSGALRYQLKPTQVELYDWWHAHEAMLSIIHARRGFGKTWFMLSMAFEFMARHPGSRQIYAAPSREECKKIVLPTAYLLIPATLPRDIRPVWMASDHCFAHPNGATLVIEGADDDNGDHLRGPFADRAYCDEFGFWRRPYDVWQSVIFPQVERRNGRALGVSTSPRSPMHEFATKLIPEAKSEGAYVVVSLENDYTLSDHAKDKIAAQHSPNRDAEEGRRSTIFRREYGCELVTESEHAVMPEFDVELHVAEHKRPEYFDGYTVLDLGMTDLSHCLFSYYDFAEATIVVEAEVVRQYVTVSQLAPEIWAMEQSLWGEARPRKRVSDAQPIALAEFARQHILQPKIVPKEMRFSAANNRDPEALINRSRAMLASRRIKVSPRCVELIKQLRGGLWNEKRTDFERIPGLGHLDGLMALVYTVDTIDYATNPEAAQRKYDPNLYPVEFRKAVVGQQPDSTTKNLTKLLPKPLRRIRK